MKKIFLFVAVVSAFSFTSCKKDRVCTCTSVITANGQTFTDDPEVTTYNDSNKRGAMSHCLNSTSTGTDSGVTYTVKTTCDLK